MINSEQSKISTPMATAYRIHEFGPPEVITREEVPTPVPGPGELLVKVAAAGVGPWDGWVRSGKSAIPQPLPLTLGSDLSGMVVAVGPDVTHLRVGQPVYGVTNSQFTGAYANYAIAVANMVAPKPVTIDDIEAASIPVIAVTAKQALFIHAGLVAGQTVLIHGGAGNVGAYAVQLAVRAKLRVISTAATEDLAYVKSLGAHVVIDFSQERFEDHVTDVDAVIDLVGGETQERSFSVIRKGGVLVSTVSQPDQTIATASGIKAMFFLVNVTSSELIDIAAAVDVGELRTKVGEVLALEEAVKAHMMLEGRIKGRKGKIVLRV